MAVAAAPLAFAQCLFDGCIASFDVEKRRRPYHRNCGCALHGGVLAGPRDPPCRNRLQCPVGAPGACSRGRLAVAAPAWLPSSIPGGSWLCGGGATHGSESEFGGGGSLTLCRRPPLQMAQGMMIPPWPCDDGGGGGPLPSFPLKNIDLTYKHMHGTPALTGIQGPYFLRQRR